MGTPIFRCKLSWSLPSMFVERLHCASEIVCDLFTRLKMYHLFFVKLNLIFYFVINKFRKVG